ncbi:hypothetical protein, partial [Halomonas sp. 141]|uniref:hypothetical protein n=1 Tax=Halomonas sp. 141 TaxID=2056666 RepID=UPI001E41803E
LHGANDQKVLAGGDRESVGAGFTDSGFSYPLVGHRTLAGVGNFLRGYGAMSYATDSKYLTKPMADVLQKPSTET